MRAGNKLIRDGIVPEPREVSNETFTSLTRSYYLDGVEAGYKAGYEAGYNDGYGDGTYKGIEMGMEKAWDVARKIDQDEAICDLFDASVDGIYSDYSAVEAFEKVKAYEEKKTIGKECSIIGMECPYDELCAECQVYLMVEQARAKARESEEEI